MKFLRSNYDSETSTSTVAIRHLSKVFFGKAKLHPDDKDKASELVGGRYAEMRAEIKALKYERQIEKAKCEECRKFVKACEQCKLFDKDSATAKIMYRQLGVRIKKVNKLADRINSLYTELEKDDWRRMTILKAIASKKAKKDNSNS